MRHRSWYPGAAAVAVVFLSLSVSARAQTCPNIEDNQELRKIPQIPVADGAKELSTTFDVQMKTHCIPTKTVVSKREEDGIVFTTYKAEPMPLRTYVYPDPANPGKTAWGFPGPTLRVRKAGADGTGGQGIAILLKNSLPPSNEACENACPSSIQCAADQCDPAKLDALVKACSSGTPPNNCCCVINCTQKAPNCFHGDNTTNLHFHGSHASPQEPQDFVLLELRPGTGPVSGAKDEHGSHGIYSKIVYGEYQYRVDPFRNTQPAGTHWYHPHKHGSVGMQVANGMAGAMIIDGPFDDWMKEQKLYDDDGEKLMVVQQIALGTNLFQQGRPRQILINGQLSPRIKVEPGEIQRWRIVNATMSSQAMLNIKLDPRLILKQIAMDGIRFSPTNYLCQPLANFNPKKPPAAFPCDFDTKITQITLAPGNRVDFLVQMPLQETGENHPPLRIERQMVDIVDEELSQRRFLREEDEAMAPGIPEPALFQVIVDDGIEGNDAEPKVLSATAPQLPKQLPALSDDVKSVAAAEARVPSPITMTFEQVQAVTGKPWPYTASPLSQFKIDGRQFDSSCANVTTVVGTAKVWTVSNATQLPHPFHIHTNPFALLDFAGAKLLPGGRPEPIWMDTMPLPVASLPECTDPGQCPNPVTCTLDPNDPKYGKTCSLQNASMTFVQRYEEFTGEYVLHCHFLGHEDRGMMFSVQTVCSDKYPTSVGKYGHPNRLEECAGPSPFPAALPPCK